MESTTNYNDLTPTPVKTVTQCWTYKSSRKDEMYLYLTREDDFQDVPEELMVQFGKPIAVMQLDLHPQRILSRADVNEVIDKLHTDGWYLQMPPKLVPDLYHGNDL